MWLSDAQSMSASVRGGRWEMLITHDTCSLTTEIGIALVAFGIFFMFLGRRLLLTHEIVTDKPGVMLLFDGALLALGNVRWTPSCLYTIVLIIGRSSSSLASHSSSAQQRPFISFPGKKNGAGRSVSSVVCECISPGSVVPSRTPGTGCS
jgi:hypothetical protein